MHQCLCQGQLGHRALPTGNPTRPPPAAGLPLLSADGAPPCAELRLALHQLWVLSGTKEAAREEEEQEEQGGSDEDRASIILIWPTSSCVATFT